MNAPDEMESVEEQNRPAGRSVGQVLKRVWKVLSGKGDWCFSHETIVLILALGLGMYHVCLLALYAYYDMDILTIINVFSVLLYAACSVAAWRRVKAIYILRVFYVEIILQVLAAGIMLGHECGFQFYLVAITCHAFYTGYVYRNDEKINAMHYVLIEIAAFILLRLGNAYIPLVYEFRDPWVVDALYTVNFYTAVIVVVMAMSNLLSNILRLENRLLQKNRDLEVLSHTDALTGLVNRRSIEEKYRLAVEESRAFSVLLADIDDFKDVNDTFGHNVGDEVLRKAAEIFKSSVRENDMVCRWGGEEILVFFPSCGKEGACLTAQRILERVRETCIQTGEGQEIHITMTFGVAESAEGGSLQEVIRKADERMYEGKNNGKNRVVSEA